MPSCANYCSILCLSLHSWQNGCAMNRGEIHFDWAKLFLLISELLIRKFWPPDFAKTWTTCPAGVCTGELQTFLIFRPPNWRCNCRRVLKISQVFQIFHLLLHDVVRFIFSFSGFRPGGLYVLSPHRPVGLRCLGWAVWVHIYAPAKRVPGDTFSISWYLRTWNLFPKICSGPVGGRFGHWLKLSLALAGMDCACFLPLSLLKWERLPLSRECRSHCSFNGPHSVPIRSPYGPHCGPHYGPHSANLDKTAKSIIYIKNY